VTSALACWLLWLLVRPGPAAQPRRPEILWLATAYELYGGLRRRLGGLRCARATSDDINSDVV